MTIRCAGKNGAGLAVLGLTCLCMVTSASALEMLSEQDMAGISGRDGLTMALDGAAISALQWRLEADAGTADAGVLRADGLSLTRLPEAVPSPHWYEMSLDVGSDGVDPYLAFASRLAHSRFAMQGMGVGSDPRSFGSWALQGDMEFRLGNRGIFNNAGAADAALYLALNNARFFYQQNWYYHANLTMDNLSFLWDMPQGTVGVDANGLRIAGDVNYKLEFDWLYKFHPDQDLTNVTVNDRPMMHTGWYGMLYDAEFRIASGGLWRGTEVAGSYETGDRSQGLHLDISWNYRKNQNDAYNPATDMRWVFGKTDGNRMRLEFSDWKNLEDGLGNPVTRGFHFPITLDVIPGGGSAPLNLCWGGDRHGSGCQGSLLGLQAGTVSGYNVDVNRSNADSYLLAMRGGNLLSYAGRVLVDPDGSNPQSFNWGLVYTLPNINANLVLYPGGSESDVAGGSRHQGILADILLMSQSSRDGNGDFIWQEGSHFLIVDSCEVARGCARDVNMGVGFVGADFLLAADDTRIWLKNTWAGQGFPNNYQGGIDLFSPRARMQLKGELAIVRVPDGGDYIPFAGSSLNLEGALNVRLSPPPDGESYLAYSLGARLGAVTDGADATLASGQGAFYSIYEPGRPEVAFSLMNIRGDYSLEEGRLSLYSAGETRPDGSAPDYPELSLSQVLKTSSSAAPRLADAALGTSTFSDAGRVMRADIFFGNDRLGELVIPGATFKSHISIMP
jgi:hypothetical protein